MSRPIGSSLVLLALLAAAGCSSPATDSTPAPTSSADVVDAREGESTPAAMSDAPLTVRVPAFQNGTCPIMGRPTSSSLYVDTAKGRVYVCCLPCNNKVQADLDRAYAAAYPTAEPAGNDVCPISGRPLGSDAVTRTLQGIDVAFCCDRCAAEAPKQAQAVLVKATRPEVHDVKNATCPIDGAPVDGNTVVLIGDAMVHLSNPACIAEVERDPAAALRKAEQLAGG